MSISPYIRLGEVGVEIIDGDRGANYPSKSELFSTGHCLFLSAANVTVSGFSLQQNQFITEERDQKLRKGRLQRFDCVLTTRGTVGNVAFFNKSIPHDNIRINSGMVILRPDPEVVDPRFLYTFLRSEIFSSQVKELTSGSAQPQLPIRDIRYIQMPMMPLSDQREIAAILGALDDKIEVNRKASATLEEMARALYRSWFVDFDPVWAELEGRQPAHMDAATAALFPDSFDDDGLPVGWRTVPVGELLTLNYGKALKKELRVAGQFPVYGSGGTDTTHEIALVQQPTIIVGRKGTVGSLYWEPRGCWPIDTVFYVTSKFSLAYIYRLFQQLPLAQMNTDAAVPGLNRDNVYRLEVAFPGATLITAYDQISRTFQTRIDALENENRTLATLRDTLLPRLMSGELRVGEARELIEEVA